MREYKILIIVTVLVIIILSILGLIYLGTPKNSKEVEAFYGTWKLTNNNFIALTDYVKKDYRALETITINKKNIENQSKPKKGLYTCGFQNPNRDFAVTTLNTKTEDCEKDFYLLTTLDQLIIQKNNKEWQNLIICFDLKDNMLIQRDCNTEVENVGITYQKVK